MWEKAITEIGYAFFFAPLYHPAVRQASAARKRIPGKTLFNILGPLLNPARASRRLMGVYDARLLRILGPALQQNGAKQAFVVRGQDGLDEISLTTKTDATYYIFGKDSREEVSVLDPRDYGFKLCKMDDLVCRSGEESQKDARAVLEGSPGPKTDWTILNAGAAAWIAGQAKDFGEGIEKARHAIVSGAALQKCNQIAAFSRETQ